MNPVTVQIANGNAFFIGIGMTIFAFILHFWLNKRFEIILLTSAWLIGISLVILSSTPISFWLYGFWFGLCVATRFAFKSHISFKQKGLITAVFAIFSAAICLVELPFHFTKPIPVSKNETVFVIGDSISAGIEKKEETWPNVLGDLSDLNVKNLARAGATIEMGLNQANEITSSNSLVIVEIGGNDLLGHTDSHTFYSQLDRLLRKIKNQNNQIVMFELPLLPFWNFFGRDQRILAKKYDVILIPKKILVKVFASKDDTLDGLHLSQKGHNELAESIYGLLRIEN